MGCASDFGRVDSALSDQGVVHTVGDTQRLQTANGNHAADSRAAAGEQGEAPLAKKSKTGVLKRLREVKKAEKAALKREELRLDRKSVV